MSNSRLLMIGLDAADPVLIDRWIDDGTLPNLGALRSSGAHGRLKTPARYLAGSPWPTFYTGQPPTHHGIYHDYQWRHDLMSYSRPTEAWLAATPFWRELEDPVDVVAYDVPMAMACEPYHGTEVTGWASHDKLCPPSSSPADLLETVKRRFGAWPIHPESYGPSSVSELLHLRDHLIENTRRSATLATWLLRENRWRFGIAVFAAAHRGGHRLWGRSSIDGRCPEEAGRRFDDALRDLYVACDAAVRRLCEAAGDANVMVFSLHGMMENTCRVDLLDGMLEAVLHGPGSGEPRRGWVRRIGEVIPLRARRKLTLAVPSAWRDRAMTLWTSGGVDWSKTGAFTLRADLHGYVRINLAGREAKGIVPADRFDETCARIAAGLATFRDASTGDEVVEDVCRMDEVFPDGPRRDRLPDLVVRWKETSAAAHEALVSEPFGRVGRSTPGRVPNGRSGNHRGLGFWIAAGRDVTVAGRVEQDADVLDLAPTALSAIGVRSRREMFGKPLPILGGASA